MEPKRISIPELITYWSQDDGIGSLAMVANIEVNMPKFAKLIVQNFPNSKIIADVGGAEGVLNHLLKLLGVPRVITFDNWEDTVITDIEFQAIEFTNAIEEKFDLVVGHDPCEGTNSILKYCFKNNVPFMIKFCCQSSNEKLEFDQLIKDNQSSFKFEYLNFDTVLIGRPIC